MIKTTLLPAIIREYVDHTKIITNLNSKETVSNLNYREKVVIPMQCKIPTSIVLNTLAISSVQFSEIKFGTLFDTKLLVGLLVTALLV